MIRYIQDILSDSPMRFTTSQASNPRPSQALPLLDELQGLAAKRVEATSREAKQVLHVRPGPGAPFFSLESRVDHEIPWDFTGFYRISNWFHTDFNWFQWIWEIWRCWKQNPHMRSCLGTWHILTPSFLFILLGHSCDTMTPRPCNRSPFVLFQ